MRLLIFKLRLVISLLPFLMRLAWEKFLELKALAVLVFGLLILMGLVLINHFQLKLQLSRHQIAPSSLTPTQQKLTSPLPLSYSQANSKIEQNLKLLKAQPYHRDLLVNTALLYESVNQPQKAQPLWEKARQLDPNWKFFQIEAKEN